MNRLSVPRPAIVSRRHGESLERPLLRGRPAAHLLGMPRRPPSVLRDCLNEDAHLEVIPSIDELPGDLSGNIVEGCAHLLPPRTAVPLQ